MKAAYKLHAKVWHPDRFQHDEELSKQASEKLAEINNAYKNLKDFLDDPSFYTQEHEEAETDECQEAEAEEQEESEGVSNDINEKSEAGKSNRRVKLCKLFNTICVFSWIGAFLGLGLMCIENWGWVEIKSNLLTDILYAGILPLIFVGFISYHMMRRYSNKPEKYY